MAIRRNTKFILNIFASRISVLILGAITLWLGVSVAKEAYQKYQVDKEIAHLRQEILELENKNNDFASLLDSFQDPSTVELAAKRRLNLKKPGEEVAVILRSPASYGLGRDKSDASQNLVQGPDVPHEDVAGEPQAANPPRLGNPLKWWLYITGAK